jgi:hypothetical protein
MIERSGTASKQGLALHLGETLRHTNSRSYDRGSYGPNDWNDGSNRSPNERATGRILRNVRLRRFPCYATNYLGTLLREVDPVCSHDFQVLLIQFPVSILIECRCNDSSRASLRGIHRIDRQAT